MVKGLSKGIRETLNRYYQNRANQSIMDFSKGVLRQRGWNKEEDLGSIFAEASKEGWAVEASAGKFWFSKKLLRGWHVIEVTERTMPEGGVSNIRINGEPFGVLSELADALERAKVRRYLERGAYALTKKNKQKGGDADGRN